MSHPELEFFNNLSGKLEIELSEPAQPVGGLMNLQAAPDARVVKMTLKAEVYVENDDEFRALTQAELDGVAFKGRTIKLQSEDGDPVTHRAPNGKHFTVRDLLRAVEETERQSRPDSEWLGGVDVHHIYFEGLEEDDGVWLICWGS